MSPNSAALGPAVWNAWSETVGLRTRPVSDQKKSILVFGLGSDVVWVLVLILQVLCFIVKHDLVTLVLIMILKDAASFKVLFIVSLFCAWNVTTVEINSGVYLLKTNPLCAFIYIRWSWSWSLFCKQSDIVHSVNSIQQCRFLVLWLRVVTAYCFAPILLLPYLVTYA